MDQITRHLRQAGLLFVFAMMAACAPLIAPFSLDAYKNATGLKAEVSALVDESGNQFSAHAQDVRALTIKIDAAYEFSAGMGKLNALSTQQWALIRGKDLYGEFVSTWRTQGTTSSAYRVAKKTQLNRAFDFVICLEANKQAAKSCANPGTPQ